MRNTITIRKFSFFPHLRDKDLRYLDVIEYIEDYMRNVNLKFHDILVFLVVYFMEVHVKLYPNSCMLMLVGWLCLTSDRQRGHLETAPPFTVPCEGREAR